MAEKKQTPLGYLMSMLGIGLTQLSDYLNIEKTSISKWKTGARALKPDSPYYNDIIRFFSADGRFTDRLMQIFGEIYPGETQAVKLEVLLDRFFQSKGLPSSAFGLAMGEKLCLYKSDFLMFSDSDGRKNAFSIILSRANEAPSMSVLTLLDPDDFLWILTDSEYTYAISKQLCSLMDNGMRIRIILCSEGREELFHFAPGFASSVIGHKNADIIYAPNYRDCGLRLSVAHYSGGMAAVGTEPSGGLVCMTLFSDELNVSQYSCFLDNIIYAGNPLFEVLYSKKLDIERLARLKSRTLSEALYVDAPMLPVFAMSEELVHDICRANDLSSSREARLLEYRSLLGDDVRDMRSRTVFSCYVPVQAIMDAISAGGYVSRELSFFCGQDIHVGREHLRRQISEMAEILRSSKSMRLFLIQHNDAPSPEQSIPFCKRNSYFGYINDNSGCIKLTAEPLVTEACIRRLDLIAENMPKDAKNNRYTAGLLGAMCAEL